MNVLVIPEDFRKDQFVLKPIVAAIMAAIGKPRANVRVCPEPLLGGIDQALRWNRIEEIIKRYRGMVDVYLLIVDRDGKEGRRAALDKLETRAAAKLTADRVFLAENAWQEVEVWALAGHDLPADWSWKEIRSDVNPKERFYLPFAEMRGVINELEQGRKILARESAANYRRVRARCREDVASLEERLAARLAVIG
jgi:hypothetical protein